MLFFVSAVERHETKKFGVEIEFDFADWAMTVFCNDKFGDVGWLKVGLVLVVIIDAVKEGNEVGILLDGTGFTEIGEDWARVITTSDTTRKLRESDDGNF